MSENKAAYDKIQQYFTKKADFYQNLATELGKSIEKAETSPPASIPAKENLELFKFVCSELSDAFTLINGLTQSAIQIAVAYKEREAVTTKTVELLDLITKKLSVDFPKIQTEIAELKKEVKNPMLTRVNDFLKATEVAEAKQRKIEDDILDWVTRSH